VLHIFEYESCFLVSDGIFMNLLEKGLLKLTVLDGRRSEDVGHLMLTSMLCPTEVMYFWDFPPGMALRSVSSASSFPERLPRLAFGQADIRASSAGSQAAFNSVMHLSLEPML